MATWTPSPPAVRSTWASSIPAGSTPIDALATHLRSRLGPGAGAAGVVIVVCCVVASHDQAVLVPWDAQLSIRLEPIAPASLLLLSSPLVTPRLFTLELASARERVVRAAALGVLTLSTCVVSMVVGVVAGPDSGLLCVRNGACFVGLSLLFSAWVDGRVAALVVTLVVWATGWLGSDTGPLRAYAWLNLPPGHAGAWRISLAVFVAGCIADLFDG